jgi:hemerythrin-like metal-binding protein
MVKALKWTADLSIGIELIDAQHRRIVDYINQLNDARQTGEKKAVGLVLEGLADYTLSHFGYEEAVMAAAQISRHRPASARPRALLPGSLPNTAIAMPWARKWPPKCSIR